VPSCHPLAQFIYVKTNNIIKKKEKRYDDTEEKYKFNIFNIKFWKIVVSDIVDVVKNYFLDQKFKFKTAQNSKNLRLNGHTSFEFQTIHQHGLNHGIMTYR